MGECCKLPIESYVNEKYIYKQIVTLITFTDSLKNVLQLLKQLCFAKICLLFGLLVSSFK